jgi:hypothetical protein
MGKSYVDAPIRGSQPAIIQIYFSRFFRKLTANHLARFLEVLMLLRVFLHSMTVIVIMRCGSRLARIAGDDYI